MRLCFSVVIGCQESVQPERSGCDGVSGTEILMKATNGAKCSDQENVFQSQKEL